MGSLFKSPEVPSLPPPPTPEAVAEPDKIARRKQQKTALSSQGRQGTFLTGSEGIPSPSEPPKYKPLLGQ